MADIIEFAGEFYSLDLKGDRLIGSKLRPVDDDAPIRTVKEVRDLEIKRALDRYRGNMSRAAEALGIDRRTLYRLLKEARAK